MFGDFASGGIDNPTDRVESAIVSIYNFRSGGESPLRIPWPKLTVVSDDTHGSDVLSQPGKTWGSNDSGNPSNDGCDTLLVVITDEVLPNTRLPRKGILAMNPAREVKNREIFPYRRQKPAG